MGMPLQLPPNHLTASSSTVATCCKITLHSFNLAASQVLLLENCDAPRADGSGTAGVGSGVSLYCDNSSLFNSENLWIGHPEDCVEFVQKIIGGKVFLK